MYRTNLKINISTNISGTDGEDLICNIFDDLVARLAEFVEDEYDIFNTSINKQFFVKSEKSLIEEFPIIERKLSENLDLTETLSDDFDFDTGYCDNLCINIDYEEYNPKTLSQRGGTYAIKFTKDKNLGILTDINPDNRQYENKNIDSLIREKFIEVGELLSVDWFLNGHLPWSANWQDAEKTKVNRKALEYHGINASNDEVYQNFINAIKSIKTDTDKVFSNLYRMLITSPLGKTTYEQYIRNKFEVMLAMNPTETLKCLNDMTLKFNLTDKLPSVTTWSPSEEDI